MGLILVCFVLVLVEVYYKTVYDDSGLSTVFGNPAFLLMLCVHSHKTWHLLHHLTLAHKTK